MAEYIDLEAASCEKELVKCKIKTPAAEIITISRYENPYYEILWYDLSDRCFHIGYGSYKRENVEKWLSKDFEIIKVSEVRHGRWEYEKKFFNENTWYCSCCQERRALTNGTPQGNGMNYCPNCGARMDGGKDDG